MGSMSEEMKKVMARWNEAPQEEVTEKMEAEETSVEPQFKTIRAEILHMIQTNPGITGVEIKNIMCAKHPSQSDGAISSQISALFKDFYVRRESATTEDNSHRTYAYFFNSYEEAKKLRLARRKRVKVLQERLEKAREVKAQKARQRQEQAQEREKAQMPLPFDTPAPTPVVAPAPAALDLRGYTAMDILNAVNFTQAKQLYTELKGAFGA